MGTLYALRRAGTTAIFALAIWLVAENALSPGLVLRPSSPCARRPPITQVNAAASIEQHGDAEARETSGIGRATGSDRCCSIRPAPDFLHKIIGELVEI